ncbi:MAG: hypothetical protein LQ347_007133 [Umbilicaria vellea]|nr:MAG: hypothetical protein LQ347_007133 [Umbilicaria vellea]
MTSSSTTPEPSSQRLLLPRLQPQPHAEVILHHPALQDQLPRTPQEADAESRRPNHNVDHNPQIGLPRRWRQKRLQKMPHDHRGVERQMQQAHQQAQAPSRIPLPSVQRQRRRRQPHQPDPQQGKHIVRHPEAIPLEQREQSPHGQNIGPADPRPQLWAGPAVAAQQNGHGQQRQQDALLVDLEGAEEEGPGGAGERPGQEVFAREERDGHAGGEDGDESGEEGDAAEGGERVGVQFVYGVQSAPEVGDFVFEEAAGEGEDAVDGLGELGQGWVVPG